MPPNRHRSKKKRDGGGGLTIKIKPFAKPPSLPPNFYESTVAILWTSLKCILHRRPLLLPNTNTNANTNHYPTKILLSSNHSDTSPCNVTTKSCAHSPKTSAADPANTVQKPPPPPLKLSSTTGGIISREELFGKVQDLCNNSYGPALYCELVKVLDDSAKICVLRLTASPLPIINDDGDHRHQRIVYPTPNCYANPDGGVYFPTTTSNTTTPGGAVEPDRVLLQNVWSMWNDYVQYLNCVRSVFLSLDRMFVYLPQLVDGVDNTQKERVIPRGGVGGRGDTGCSLQEGGSTGALSLWDVGMYCLWKHLGLHNDSELLGGKRRDETMDIKRREPKYSVLETLKASTIACLLLELDSGTGIYNGEGSNDYNYSNGGGMMLHHKPLVRNCVSMFRTLGHCTPTFTTNTNDVTQDFLQDLTTATTKYFTSESSKWMQDHPTSSSIGNRPTKTSYDARALLRHVDARLKQVHAMTVYYLLTSSPLPNPSSTNATAAANLEGGGIRHISDGRILTQSSSHHHLQNRILTLLVETHLLSPHFTLNHILHPTNLYPILDEQKVEVNFRNQQQQQEHQHTRPNNMRTDDVKILFQLSKRVIHRCHQQEHHLQGATTIDATGIEQLRLAFAAYGRERGASIVRPRPHHHRGSSCSGGLTPTKIIATNKETQANIVPNLLRFKVHLESLHRESFGGDDMFGKTVKKVLEDVLNDGACGGEDGSGSVPGMEALAASRRKNTYLAARNRTDAAADGGKRIAELLAKNVDLRFRNAKSSVLGGSSNPSSAIAMAGRSGSGGVGAGAVVISGPDNDGEVYQNAIMDLFRHIYSKDVFEAFYRRDLAKRLLLQKSTSIDSERSFVSKLKAECGGSYTSKMEGMFKDMDLSRDVMSNYAAYLMGTQVGGVCGVAEQRLDTDVTVLTTGYWPVYPILRNLNLSPSLETQKVQFEKYYKSKYQGRRVVWQNSLGSCIVRAHFPKISGVRELAVNLCQALVLLCFNEDNDKIDGYTILDIMDKTGLNDRGETERVLQSLSVGRQGTRVLCKIDYNEDNTSGITSHQPTLAQKKSRNKGKKTVSDKDIFIFNSNFTSNQHRVKITNIQMKETADDRSKTHEAVKLDRGYLIDAVAVRIMKARKTLKHRSLVGEVMNQLKFPANGLDVKKRIGGLIEREYIERSAEDPSLYNYLA